MTPFRSTPVKWDGNSKEGRYKDDGGFKYDVITKSVVDRFETMPKCFLADTQQEAEAIYERFEKTLNNFAYSYSISTGIDKADLFREALIGLARAYRDWDPERSDNFNTYANFIIKDSLNEYVRNNSATISVPAYIKKANSNLNEIKFICERSGIEWQVIVIEQELPQDLQEAEAIRCTELVKNLIKAAERAHVEYEKFIERVMIMPMDVEYVEQEQEAEEDQRRVEAALVVSRLKEHMDKTELAICEGIMDDKSYAQIAEEFGKSKGWVYNKINALKERILSMINEGTL